MGFLSQQELNRLLPAETHAFPGPIPTQIVSSDEYYKYTPEWRSSLATDRITAMKDEYERHGTNRSNLRYGYIARV